MLHEDSVPPATNDSAPAADPVSSQSKKAALPTSTSLGENNSADANGGAGSPVSGTPPRVDDGHDLGSPTPSSSQDSPEVSQSVDPYELREKIIQVLHTVYDPEIPVDIWELGLIYKLDVREDGDVYIQMTLTSPMCPVAGSLPPEVQQKVASVSGVRNVQVELTWDPPWHMGMMSEVARLKLGFM